MLVWCLWRLTVAGFIAAYHARVSHTHTRHVYVYIHDDFQGMMFPTVEVLH